MNRHFYITADILSFSYAYWLYFFSYEVLFSEHIENLA